MEKRRILSLAAALLTMAFSACGAKRQTDGVSQDGDPDLVTLTEEAPPLAELPSEQTPAAEPTVKKNSSTVIDYSEARDGCIRASWLAGGSDRIKVLIKGPGGTQYQYNLRTDGEYETFPLSDGSGSYSVGVYRNISGAQYSTVLSCSVNVELADEFAPFLRSNQYVNFTEDSRAVAKAAELCAGAADNLEKVKRVYTFVVNNTAYDKVKAQTVQSGYLPDVDETLETGKGICFDYAALMSAMLRSQNVPVKLIVGYTGSIYHAWINVWSETEGWIEAAIFFDGNEWELMDPTFASSGSRSAAIMQYISDSKNYTAKYQY